jgi:hypothetical protein
VVADLFVNVLHKHICNIKAALQVGEPILAAIKFGVKVVGNEREYKAFEVCEDASKVKEIFIAFICVLHVEKWKNDF